MNKVTAESRERDSAGTVFGPGDYCALTFYRREQFIVQSEGIDEDTNEADIQMLWTRQA